MATVMGSKPRSWAAVRRRTDPVQDWWGDGGRRLVHRHGSPYGQGGGLGVTRRPRVHPGERPVAADRDPQASDLGKPD